MEHRRVCFCMLSLLPLVQISKLSQANSLLFGKVCCRTPRGVRGLKFRRSAGWVLRRSRTPRGVRGLKYAVSTAEAAIAARRTPRGVRGLKSHRERGNPRRKGRTPRGVRGLKSGIRGQRGHPGGRTPRGVRGLKFFIKPAKECGF